MKRNFLFSVLFPMVLAFYAGNTSAQSSGDPFKPLPQVNKEFLVSAHIVLNQAGVPGMDSITIVNQLNSLNDIFKPIGISFKLCSVDYVPNFQLDNIAGTQRKELLTEYRQPSRLNLYYVTSMSTSQDNYVDADQGGITSSGNVGIILSKTLATKFLIAHAFGHYFNLLHTNEGFGSELVDESNCSIEGDQVCDTPADPWDTPLHQWQNNCLFVDKTKKDAKGNYYEPDISNLMSMYDEKCMCYKFTHGQYLRMAEYYLKNPVSW